MFDLGNSRKTYTREFKIEAVKQVVEQGRSAAVVAENLGVHASLLRNWKRQLLAEGAVAFPGQGRRSESDAEISRLRRELSIARQEREILRKAAAYFANDGN